MYDTPAPTNPFASTPRPFLTDGGLETSLIFDEGIELPEFAAFTLLREQAGVDTLIAYYERYIKIAQRARTGFVLETPTWRANPDWGDRLGYSKADLAKANTAAINLLQRIKVKHASNDLPILISGCIGPRRDGYVPGEIMSDALAEAYHNEQIEVLERAGADLISAITMTNAPEAIGIARASARNGLPCVLSFTVETDGRLPTGQALKDAIEEVDAETDFAPLHYMINCAHPSHFSATLEKDAPWAARLGGLRVNASCRSHAELDEAETLDRGDPAALARAHAELVQRFPALRVFGGCCGTDHPHVSAICDAIVPSFAHLTAQ